MDVCILRIRGTLKTLRQNNLKMPDGISGLDELLSCHCQNIEMYFIIDFPMNRSSDLGS